MSCKEAVQMMSSNTVNSGSYENTLCTSIDPYVFSEPPSIQDLPLYKMTAKGQTQQNERISLHQVTTSNESNFKMAMDHGFGSNELKRKVSNTNIDGSSAAVHNQTRIHLPPQPSDIFAKDSSNFEHVVIGQNFNILHKAHSQPDTVTNNIIGSTDQRSAPHSTAPKVGCMPLQRTSREKKSPPASRTDLKLNSSGLNKTINKRKRPRALSKGRANQLEKVICWHAPHAYIFDDQNARNINCSDSTEITATFMRHWFLMDVVASSSDNFGPHSKFQTVSDFTMNDQVRQRDDRLEIRRVQLRRKTMQYSAAQRQRFQLNAKRRFLTARSMLDQYSGTIDVTRTDSSNLTRIIRQCAWDLGCSNEAIVMTAYCKQHITQDDDQLLYVECTAQLADSSQCRVPVFDIGHELPVCPKHAWKKDVHCTQEYKSKRSHGQMHLTNSRVGSKKAKPSAMVALISDNNANGRIVKPNAERVIANDTFLVAKTKIDQQAAQPNVDELGDTDYVFEDLVDEDCELDVDDAGEVRDNIYGKNSSPTEVTIKIKRSTNDKKTAVQQLLKGQSQPITDMFFVCENSSAYESSEDTGVGGLSESELIEEIGLDSRLLEDPELNNVLNQFPEDDFSELFSVQHSDPEVFDGVLEVDDEVKTMEMTGTFLGDFLADHVLEETDMGTASDSINNELRPQTHYLHTSAVHNNQFQQSESTTRIHSDALGLIHT